ncbi:MAG: dihydropteroate synthase, partial [Alistipes sp.]|nr:dihydropteroate synthase [Alistipes sp.]
FYSGSRTPEKESIVSRVREVVDEGTDIIDIGGYSTRPGAEEVSCEEELRRVLLGVECVRELFPNIPISIDTFRAAVVRGVVERYGAVIVNDISAGELDSEMVAVVAELGLPYIAMHMRGTPQTMQQMADYGDVADDIYEYFKRRCRELTDSGISKIIIDPGFGFAKSTEQNYRLLSSLNRLKDIGYPILVGLSRKSMIYKVLRTTPEESLMGTSALNWEALRQGASILRVHDVKEAVQVRRLFEIFEESRG